MRIPLAIFFTLISLTVPIFAAPTSTPPPPTGSVDAGPVDAQNGAQTVQPAKKGHGISLKGIVQFVEHKALPKVVSLLPEAAAILLRDESNEEGHMKREVQEQNSQTSNNGKGSTSTGVGSLWDNFVDMFGKGAQAVGDAATSIAGNP